MYELGILKTFPKIGNILWFQFYYERRRSFKILKNLDHVVVHLQVSEEKINDHS